MLGGRGIWGVTVLSDQLCSEHKTALKIKPIFLKKICPSRKLLLQLPVLPAHISLGLRHKLLCAF